MCPFSVRVEHAYTPAAFLGNWHHLFLTRITPFIPHVFILMWNVLNNPTTTSLRPALPIAGEVSHFRHCITTCSSTGISTWCPSATPFGLVLGPDSPWEDEPCPGNLSQIVKGILTLYRYLRRHSHFYPLHHSFRYDFNANRTLPYHEYYYSSATSVPCLAPVNFRRGNTWLVSCYAFFKWWLPLSQHPSCLSIPTSFNT